MTVKQCYFQYKNMMKITISIILALVTLVSCKLPIIDEDIGQAIFHQGKIYTLYVCDQLNDDYVKMFEEFCGEDRLCALLDRSVELHSMFNQFVRMDHPEYLLILDAQHLHKYTMRVDETLTVDKINDFNNKFEEGVWPRFYTSEEIPKKNNDPFLTKIVGKTFQDFIEGSQPLKVIYLYSDSEGCSGCKDVYDLTSKAAQRFTNREQISFGSLDPFRNEHELLEEVEIPVILLYVNGEKNRLTEMEDIEKLEERIEAELGKISPIDEL